VVTATSAQSSGSGNLLTVERDELDGDGAPIMARVAARPANVRKMAWLMPRMAKAVPFLGYIVVVATKPA
jgi:hypothetical protein